MKVVITGGGGFIGSQIARQLCERGELTGVSGKVEKIDAMTLLDARFGEPVRTWANQQGGISDLTLLEADISDQAPVFDAIDREDVTVFHLAAMVSGECEQRFDDAMAVNLEGTRHVLDALRRQDGRPRVIFASSVGAYGGEVMPETISDATKTTPQTTYGMTKVMGELMINDYSRKGFLDGRAVRLPTVIIRPGKPNAAASSWASGMYREPLNGETCYLPVRRDQFHPVIGYRDVVKSFISLHEVPEESLSDDRVYVLPSHRVSVDEGLSVLAQVANERGIELGEVVDQPDPVVQAIVNSWPTGTDAARALQIGLPEPAPLDEIIAGYIDDFVTPAPARTNPA